MSMRGQRGFTLLEAIVAMVVFSMGALALYGWLSTNVITLQRIRDHQQEEAAVLSALDLIRRGNPMEMPSGGREVGGLSVVWSSKLVEPARQGASQDGSPTIFLVGLYEVDVQVSRNGEALRGFKVRQIGWKQTASTQD